MMSRRSVFLAIFVLAFLPEFAISDDILFLEGEALTRIMPASFYFEGRSGPTQMRNAVAVRFGEKRHVIAALVDTEGYASEIRDKYEGFFITDSKISVGGQDVVPGAYGFGFTKESKFNLFDVGGNLLVSAQGARDTATRTPRPLTILKDNGGVRLYRGRSYVVFAVK
jgi:hypothetical protein